MNTVTIKLLEPVSITKPRADKNYQQMVVSHKDLSSKDQKIDGKKITDFATPKPVWEALSNAKAGDIFRVTREKQNGFWQWTSIQPSSEAEVGEQSKFTSPAGSDSTPSRSGTNSKPERVGSWETPDERAAKQVYIVRQSSVSSATEILKSQGEPFSFAEVKALAKEIEEYVFGDKLDLSTEDFPG